VPGAGHGLAERDVALAEAALAAAQGRRERKQAEAALEQARGVLRASDMALRTVEKQQSFRQAVGESMPVQRAPQPRGRVPDPEHMSKSDALTALRAFGDRRRAQGDEFDELDHRPPLPHARRDRHRSRGRCPGPGRSAWPREVAGFADGVIVGSALVSAAEHGRAAVARLTTELAAGVRGQHAGR